MAFTNSMKDLPVEGLADATFKCPQCPKSYKRLEHLQRHTASHSSGRPYHCNLCGATFQRSDVLKRHAKTCNGKWRRGTSTNRQACDQCSKSKQFCDWHRPCINCQRRGITCTFLGLAGSTNTNVSGGLLGLSNSTEVSEASQMLLGWSNFDFIVGDEQSLADPFTTWPSSNGSGLTGMELHGVPMNELGWPVSSSDPTQQSVSLRFLESFTRGGGLITSFDCCTETLRNLLYDTLYSDIDGSPGLGAAIYGYELAEDPIGCKSLEIVSLVEEAVRINPRNSAISLTWTPILHDECLKFFAPKRIRLYLELYWAIWHPNVNFMHRPSFNVESTKPALLAAMAIIGACVSPQASDNKQARVWFDCIEEVVFRDDDFCSLDNHGSQRIPSPARIQSLQAAYIVCLFQNWEGTESSKRRIRRFRYSTVIAVARDLGIMYARHQRYTPESAHTFSWSQFVAEEQLIRVLLWVFLLDTAFVIFNNLPPRMAIKEMTMHFACSEGCFQAPTSDTCFFDLLQGSQNTHLQFSVTAERLCKSPIDLLKHSYLGELGPLNLFALTSGTLFPQRSDAQLSSAGLHSMLFQLQQSFCYEMQLTPIHQALDNWTTIWQVYSTTFAHLQRHTPIAQEDLNPENMWKRVGFSRFCSEYWLLANLITEKLSSSAPAGDHDVLDSFYDTSTSGDLKQSREVLLSKYDETSMRQINDLIADFQAVIL